MDIESQVKEMLNLMRVEPQSVEVQEDERYIFINIKVGEDDAGKLIGNKGEVIQALSYILALSFNEKLQDKRFVVDVNDYKSRREERAVEIGLEAAQQAREDQFPVDLPPLSSFERRAVHQALSEEEDIFTKSEGVGLSRRLVVYPESYRQDVEGEKVNNDDYPSEITSQESDEKPNENVSE